MKDQNDMPHERVAAIEARLEAVCDRLDTITEQFAAFIDKRSSSAWQVLGLIIAGAGLSVTIIMPLGTAVAFLLWVTIENNGDRIDAVEVRHDRMVEYEQQRNNRIERELGAASAIDELFKQGKLKLE